MTKALQSLDGSAKVEQGKAKDDIHVFAVTLPEKVGVDKAKLDETVKGFKVERASTVLVGEVSRDGLGRLVLKTRAAGLDLRLQPGPSDLKEIEAGLGEGVKSFRIAGDLKTLRERAEEREVEVPALEVAQATPMPGD